ESGSYWWILQYFRAQLSRFVAQLGGALKLEFFRRGAHFGLEFGDRFGELFRVVDDGLFDLLLRNLDIVRFRYRNECHINGFNNALRRNIVFNIEPLLNFAAATRLL